MTAANNTIERLDRIEAQFNRMEQMLIDMIRRKNPNYVCPLPPLHSNPTPLPAPTSTQIAPFHHVKPAPPAPSFHHIKPIPTEPPSHHIKPSPPAAPPLPNPALLIRSTVDPIAPLHHVRNPPKAHTTSTAPLLLDPAPLHPANINPTAQTQQPHSNEVPPQHFPTPSLPIPKQPATRAPPPHFNPPAHPIQCNTPAAPPFIFNPVTRPTPPHPIPPNLNASSVPLKHKPTPSVPPVPPFHISVPNPRSPSILSRTDHTQVQQPHSNETAPNSNHFIPALIPNQQGPLDAHIKPVASSPAPAPTEIRQATLDLLPQNYADEEMAKAAEIPPEPPPIRLVKTRGRVFS